MMIINPSSNHIAILKACFLPINHRLSIIKINPTYKIYKSQYTRAQILPYGQVVTCPNFQLAAITREYLRTIKCSINYPGPNPSVQVATCPNLQLAAITRAYLRTIKCSINLPGQTSINQKPSPAASRYR